MQESTSVYIKDILTYFHFEQDKRYEDVQLLRSQLGEKGEGGVHQNAKREEGGGCVDANVHIFFYLVPTNIFKIYLKFMRFHRKS